MRKNMDQDYVCGDYGEESIWTQIRVTVKLPKLDELTAIMSMVSNNLQIEDYSDIDLKTCYGDLIDESILNADKTVAAVSVFLPADRPFTEAVAFIRDRMRESGIDENLITGNASDEDKFRAYASVIPFAIGNPIYGWTHLELRRFQYLL